MVLVVSNALRITGMGFDRTPEGLPSHGHACLSLANWRYRPQRRVANEGPFQDTEGPVGDLSHTCTSHTWRVLVGGPWAPLQRLQQRYASLAVLAYETLPSLSCDGAHIKVASKRPVSRLAQECEMRPCRRKVDPCNSLG